MFNRSAHYNKMPYNWPKIGPFQKNPFVVYAASKSALVKYVVTKVNKSKYVETKQSLEVEK